VKTLNSAKYLFVYLAQQREKYDIIYNTGSGIRFHWEILLT